MNTCANTGVDRNKDLADAITATSALFRGKKRAETTQPPSAPAAASSAPLEKRTTEGVPSPAVDRVVELLIQRRALMALALRVGQDHGASARLLDAVFDIDQELGAAPLSSAEGAAAALRFIQDQYLGDRHNESLGMADTTVVHLLAELGEFVRRHPPRAANPGDFDNVEIPF